MPQGKLQHDSEAPCRCQVDQGDTNSRAYNYSGNGEKGRCKYTFIFTLRLHLSHALLQTLLVEATGVQQNLRQGGASKLNVPWDNNHEMNTCLHDADMSQALIIYCVGKGFTQNSSSDFSTYVFTPNFKNHIMPLK